MATASDGTSHPHFVPLTLAKLCTLSIRVDSTVLVWQFVSEGAAAPAFGEESDIVNKETWNVVRLLRCAYQVSSRLVPFPS